MSCHPADHRSRRASAGRALRALAVAGAALSLAGCFKTTEDHTAGIPSDYRKRHPISIQERDNSLELLVGNGRGGLTLSQRSEVAAFAQAWRREATGGVIIDRPVGTPNERAALDSIKQILPILVGSGIPNHGIGIQPFTPTPDRLATIRIRFPQMSATAGPCGLWPEDLGPTYQPAYRENRPYYNLGCATQRNHAAMIANPHDLIQPRAEGPVYASKRTYSLSKWRRGESPASTYPDPNKGALSDLGK